MSSRGFRTAPDAEWVLMYRQGMTRARIADLENVSPSTVGYHLTVAKARNPPLQAEHDGAAPMRPVARVTTRTLERMGELTLVRAEGRFPSTKATDTAERSLAVWLQRRRRDAENGRLAPEVLDGLACLENWQGRPRSDVDEERWRRRLNELTEFRTAGHDWPRHKGTDNAQEHTLGVWLHAQRHKLRRGELDPAKLHDLDTAAPGLVHRSDDNALDTSSSRPNRLVSG